MRTLLVFVVLSWAFLLLRLADDPGRKRAAAEPAVERFSMNCSYERTDTVGGLPATRETRTGSCSGPQGEPVALAPRNE